MRNIRRSYLAASLTKVMDGYVMTSVLSTNDTKVDMQEPLVELDEVDPVWDESCSIEFEFQNRERERERERDSDTIKGRIFKYGRKKAIDLMFL